MSKGDDHARQYPRKHIQIAIDVGDADVIDLKIKSGSIIGTLHIEKEGLSFSPSNSKKEPEHTLDWEQLPQLIALSNGFAKRTK